jgi:hypothetical protein
MKLLSRFLTVLAGYIAAATAGLIVPAAAIFIGIPDANSLRLSAILAAISGISYLIFLVGGSLLVPALFIIGICEALRVRNVFAYLALGVLVAGPLAIYTLVGSLSIASDLFNLTVAIVTGAVAGCIYWRIAGKTAGGWRD